MRNERYRYYLRFRVAQRRRETKRKAIEYKGGACEGCGYNRCVAALHFHHLDPTKKDVQVSKNTMSWERVKAELDKCEMLCANCHAEKHHALEKPRLEKKAAEFRKMFPDSCTDTTL
jgi:5-methylcytosine-specific restriction endonuclease McrA